MMKMPLLPSPLMGEGEGGGEEGYVAPSPISPPTWGGDGWGSLFFEQLTALQEYRMDDGCWLAGQSIGYQLGYYRVIKEGV